MRLTSISASNFLTFGKFEWQDIRPDLNVIVGPNGAGKTNLFRALRALRASLDYTERTAWEQAGHATTSDVPFRLSAGVRFDSPWERDLISTFVASAACDEYTAYQGRPNWTILRPDSLQALSSSLIDAANQDAVSWLLEGTIVAEYLGRGRWHVAYEGQLPEGQQFRWDLDAPGNALAVAPATGTGGVASSPLLEVWLESLSNADSDVFASFARGETASIPGFDLSVALLSGHGAQLQVTRPQQAYLPTHVRLQRLIGEPLDHSRHYTPAAVFRRLLDHGLVFTSNTPVEPLYEVTPEDLTGAELRLGDGSQLALYLVRLRNGQRERQAEYRRVEEIFERLSHRTFTVGFEQSLRSDARSESDRMRLAIRIGEQWGEVALSLSGAGVGEALHLSALLASSEDRVLLLDEPARTLHPPVQEGFVQMLATRQARQCFLITHTATLVPPYQVANASRFALRRGQTVRSALSQSLEEEDRARFETLFRTSLDARGLLFARAVILVEGESELGALPAWSVADLDRNLESEGVTVYSVSSDTNFKPHVQLLEQFQIPWAIVCDGRVIGDSSQQGIHQQLRRAGVAHEARLVSKQYERRREVLARRGVFTVAGTPKGNFDQIPTLQINWKSAEAEMGTSKPRIARFIAENRPCPPEVRRLLRNVLAYLDNRLQSLEHPQTSVGE